MERRLLQPEQIIVPGEYELGNESILKIYFRVFDRGHGGDFPPAIVTTSGSLERVKDRLEEYFTNYEDRFPEIVAARRNDYTKFSGILQQHPYLLIDGNHKTAAATLTHNPIHALEIQTDSDFEEIESMIERGELFDFKRPERSLDRLRDSYIAHCLGLQDDRIPPRGLVRGISNLKYTKTIKERIDELTSNGDLPQYMKERYHRRK